MQLEAGSSQSELSLRFPEEVGLSSSKLILWTAFKWLLRDEVLLQNESCLLHLKQRTLSTSTLPKHHHFYYPFLIREKKTPLATKLHSLALVSSSLQQSTVSGWADIAGRHDLPSRHETQQTQQATPLSHRVIIQTTTDAKNMLIGRERELSQVHAMYCLWQTCRSWPRQPEASSGLPKAQRRRSVGSAPPPAVRFESCPSLAVFD